MSRLRSESKPKDVQEAAEYFQSAIIAFQSGDGTEEERIRRLVEATSVFNGTMARLTHGRSRKAANDNNPAKPFPGIVSSGKFVADFVPPDYLLEGIAQLRFIYSLTGMTGAGKTAVLLLLAYCVATGNTFCGLEVKKGRVLYSAGENPDDVKMRWIAMAHAFGFDPDAIDVHFVAGVYSIPDSVEKIRDEIARLGDVSLIVVDTSAAFFHGDDENSNTQAGKHARDMRELTEMPGGPCVITAAHPIKNASADNLLPRGGGAFLNEVDGNLTLTKSDGGSRMHWQGKHRGPDFEPLYFSLEKVTAPDLVDSQGRPIPTVMAKELSHKDVHQQAQAAQRDLDDVLLEIRRDGKQSLRDMAERLGWFKDSEPHKDRVRRATDKLKGKKLIAYQRHRWKLTTKGEEEATEAAAEKLREEQAASSLANFVRKARYGDED